jgi:NhaA family Na+:H+ antiporter
MTVVQPNGLGLPRELADHFTRPFARFLKIEAAAGLLLLVATSVALVLSNSVIAERFHAFWEAPVGLQLGSVSFVHPLRHWINDGLMTLFFFVVALELKRELMHGELRSLRIAAFSLAGALGGMLVPALLYLTVMRGAPGAHGWGTVMATDTAFVLGSLAVLGARIPTALRLFLLSLAIFDDIGAMLIVALGYGDAIYWPALALAVAIIIAVLAASRLGIRSVPTYCVLGAAMWLALDTSGIHPTLAGVILGLMTPAHEWVSDARLHHILERVVSHPRGQQWSGDTAERADLKRAAVAAKEALSPVERLELSIHPWSAFLITPLFALANAGVTIAWNQGVDPVSAAVFMGLVVGKPLGVVAVSWLAVRVGLATRPYGMQWSLLSAGSLLTGIGFTMSLLIAGLAFEPDMLVAAKVGILAASIVAGAAGILSLAWLTRHRRFTAAAVVTGLRAADEQGPAARSEA